MVETDRTTEDGTIIIHTENGIQNIRPEQFPEIIRASLERMEELDKLYRKAELAARYAQSEVDSAKKVADSAKSDVLSVVNRSDEVSRMSAGPFKKKAAIEGLQEGHVELAKSQKGLADAVMQLTDVQGSFVKAQADTMEALKVSFEFDKDITNITKYLFLLGCSSIAASQTVCRSLEMKLKDASEEEISDLARKELQNVIDNLRAQENVMTKQRQMEEELGIFIDVVHSNSEKLEKHEDELQRIIEKETEQDNHLEKQITIACEHEKRLSEGEVHDKIQDEELEERAQKDIEHDKRLDETEKKDVEQDRILEYQQKRDEEHDRRLNEGDIRDNQQDKLLEILQEEINRNREEIEKLSFQLSEAQQNSSDCINELNSKVAMFALKRHAYIAEVIGIVALIIGILQLVS